MFLLRWKVVTILVIALCTTSMMNAQTLVDDPFLTSYDGWVNGFNGYTIPSGVTRYNTNEPNWGLLLAHNVLAENSDGYIGGLADGDFIPIPLVQPAGVDAPLDYTLNGTFMADDNDGLGLVFGFQDNDNYFRVTSRPQGTGFGCPGGISVQKVVAGVGATIGVSASSVTPYSTGTAFDLTVVVSGTGYDVIYDGNSIISGTDAALAPGGYGVHSWGQRRASPGSDLGTQVSQVTMTAGTDVTTHTFTNTGTVSWRELTMSTSANATITGSGYQQNFIANFINGTIIQDSNGFGYATPATTPNVDFIAPTVVVDDPTSDMWTDYEVKTRMQNGDDDGMGLLLRVQDDDNFYRVEFTMQAMGTDGKRPPQGMSVQKCVDGVWTELYRDTQGSSLFVYAKDVPFDVSVAVVGNEIDVQVINDPDGAATVINYPTVTDAASSLMSGTVGLTVWGSGEATNGGIYSPYGGQAGPLVTAILVPEPSTIVLILMGVLMLVIRKRAR